MPKQYEDGTDYTFILEDPPDPAGRAPRALSDIERNLLRCTETPGEWARIGTYKNKNTTASVVHALKTGRTAPKRPPGIWEFVRGETDEGEHGVWARFNPGAPDE